MQDHRIRLNDAEIAAIVSALRARKAGVAKRKAAQLQRLIDRLDDGGAGNPDWRFDDPAPRLTT